MQFAKDTSSYSLFQTYRATLATGGEVRIVATDANHIHFDGNHHCVNGRPGDRCWIVCRDIEYGASIHFQRVAGEWTTMDRPYVSRVSTSKDASPAAIKWIVEAARAVVLEFVAQHPEVLAIAQRNHDDAELEGLRTKLGEARQTVADLLKAIDQLTWCYDCDRPKSDCACVGDNTCAVCGIAGPVHGHWSITDPTTHKFVSK